MILKKKIYLSLAIFAVINLFFLIFVVYHIFSKIKGQSQDFIKQKNYYLELQTRNHNFQELAKFKEEYQDEFSKIDGLFIDADVPIDFNNFLRKTAQGINLQIEIADVKAGKPETNQWNFLNYQIILTGSFGNLTRFLDKLENSSYLIEVNALNIKKLTGKDSSLEELNISLGDVRAEVVVKVYTR